MCTPARAGDLSTPPAPFLGQRVLGRPPAEPIFAFSPVSPRAEECGVTTCGALRRGACVAGTRERPLAAALFLLSIFVEGNERRGTKPGPGWGADGVSAESTPRGSFPLAPRGSSVDHSPKKLKSCCQPSYGTGDTPSSQEACRLCHCSQPQMKLRSNDPARGPGGPHR